MDQEQYKKVQNVYEQLLKISNEKRTSKLDELTQDPVVKEEVLALLKFTNEDTLLTSNRTGLPVPTTKSKKVNLGALRPIFTSTLIFRTILFAALGILLGLGIWTHQNVADNLQELRRSELKRTINALDLSLNNWIEDYKHDVRVISRDPELRIEIQNFLETRDNKTALRNLLNQSIDAGRYSGFAIISLEGEVVLTNNPNRESFMLPSNRFEALNEVVKGETYFGTPIDVQSLKANENNVLRVDRVWVSHLIKSKEGKNIGVISISRPAHKEFDQIFSVHKLGETGESYAVNQNGLMITPSRFESELKNIGLISEDLSSPTAIYAKDPGVRLKSMSAEDPRELWAFTKPAQAITSYAVEKKKAFGIFNEPYRDYRGEKVIGAWTWFPDYRFGIITEIDAAEAYSVLPYISVSFVVIGVILAGLFITSMFSTLNLVRISEKANKGKFGHYIIQDQIGEGGMSKVYLAHHEFLLRPTALKILKKETLNESSLKRFKSEAHQISRLKNPHTIELYDYGQKQDGTLYYAMELLEGLTIKELVKINGPLPVNRTLYLLLSICYSLKEAHDLNLIHRDIKPLNIMVCVMGGMYDMVKVLDFGLVKDLERNNEEDFTKQAEITGTPLYMAPERITAPKSIDHRSDIYAIGALAYYMLSAQPIFDYKNDLDIMYHIINTTPKPVNTINPEVPLILSNLISVCLEKDVDLRPDNIDYVISILTELQNDAPYSPQDAKTWWMRFKG